MIVRRYEPRDDAAIGRLNGRLAAAGQAWTVYPEGPHDQRAGSLITSRLFVAEQDPEIRGSVWLREHDFRVANEPIRAGWAKYIVSESLIDPSFGSVPGGLMLRLLREQPYLMVLGMGGEQGQYAKLLSALRWTGTAVPFYVLPVRPARVLRRLRQLRRTAARRLALDLLAASGLGWIGVRGLGLARSIAAGRPRSCAVEVADRFAGWADAVWDRCAGQYGFLARRDAVMLNEVYPAEMPVTRLRMRRGGDEIGWAVVVRKAFGEGDSTPFGPLHVGAIADVLADPADAAAVVRLATDYLRSQQVDLIFSNQLHPAWCGGLHACGFVRGPSQFALFWSHGVDQRAGPRSGWHFNRGDCDGPIFWT